MGVSAVRRSRRAVSTRRSREGVLAEGGVGSRGWRDAWLRGFSDLLLGLPLEGRVEVPDQVSADFAHQADDGLGGVISLEARIALQLPVDEELQDIEGREEEVEERLHAPPIVHEHVLE